MTQNEIVLKHIINHGYITQIIASNYGIRRCSARIKDLKNNGVPLVSKMKKDDMGVRYAYYTFDPAVRTRK
jgi:hypothetical protein